MKSRSYKKGDPFRDATLIIVVCEGTNTEPKYFRFFDRKSTRLKVAVVPADVSKGGGSSPKQMIANAKRAIRTYDFDSRGDELWIVVDVDKWVEHGIMYDLYQECKEQNWKIVISNPCFEVWLNYHFTSNGSPSETSKCKSWKIHVANSTGGFNPKVHPANIKIAIEQCETGYKETGFLPNQGCSQVYRLGKRIIKLLNP